MVEAEGTILRSMDQYERVFYPKRYAREREDPGEEAHKIGYKYGAKLGHRIRRALEEIDAHNRVQAKQSTELLLSGPEDNRGTQGEGTNSQ